MWVLVCRIDVITKGSVLKRLVEGWWCTRACDVLCFYFVMVLFRQIGGWLVGSCSLTLTSNCGANAHNVQLTDTCYIHYSIGPKIEMVQIIAISNALWFMIQCNYAYKGNSSESKPVSVPAAPSPSWKVRHWRIAIHFASLRSIDLFYYCIVLYNVLYCVVLSIFM